MQLQSGFAQHIGLEFGPVFRLAGGGGGDHGQGADLHPFGQKRKAFERLQCPDPALGVQIAGLHQTFAKPAHDFFIVEIGRAAGCAIKDHHPDRVRPTSTTPTLDSARAPSSRKSGRPKGAHSSSCCAAAGRVWLSGLIASHGSSGLLFCASAGPGQPSVCRGPRIRPQPVLVFAAGPVSSSRPHRIRGASLAPAVPRPESDGFSMKKRWQLKRDPSAAPRSRR